MVKFRVLSRIAAVPITVTVDMYGHMAPTVVADAVARGMAGYGR